MHSVTTVPYKKYDELISSHQNALRVYADSVKSLRGKSGADFERALAEAEVLRRTCRSIEGELLAYRQKIRAASSQERFVAHAPAGLLNRILA